MTPKAVVQRWKVKHDTLAVSQLEESDGPMAWGVDGVELIAGGYAIFDSVGEAQGYVFEEAMARANQWMDVAEGSGV